MPRTVVVIANLVVAVAVTALQVVVLLLAAVLRGAELHTSAPGVAWFAAAGVLLAIAMYGVAETIANRVPSVEEYVGLVPGLAIVPFFFAGSLFPITAMPAFLTAFAKFLPITHTLAVMRYGLLGADSSGLHDIWGITNTTVMVSLSLAVVALFATTLTVVALRTFKRSAVSSRGDHRTRPSAARDTHRRTLDPAGPSAAIANRASVVRSALTRGQSPFRVGLCRHRRHPPGALLRTLVAP